jgi:hypothetical protein
MENLHNTINSRNIDKLAHFAILYITGRSFLDSQRKYLTNYFHGKIRELFEDEETQAMSTMLNRL